MPGSYLYILMQVLSLTWSRDFVKVSVASIILIAALDPDWKILHLYSAELFPSEIRNMARGACLVGARLGSVCAPSVSITLLCKLRLKILENLSNGDCNMSRLSLKYCYFHERFSMVEKKWLKRFEMVDTVCYLNR